MSNGRRRSRVRTDTPSRNSHRPNHNRKWLRPRPERRKEIRDKETRRDRDRPRDTGNRRKGKANENEPDHDSPGSHAHDRRLQGPATISHRGIRDKAGRKTAGHVAGRARETRRGNPEESE